MKIILAPDSFKESLSAKDVCKAMKSGILNVLPSADIVEFPMADGGEGTIDALIHATKGKSVIVDIKDPLLRDIKGNYGVLGDNETCVIEIAQAVGLNLLNKSERNPLKTTSYGIGEIIKHALNDGYKKFIVGLGGSCTNDGGAGMLQALGIKLFTESKQEIQPCGENLKYVHSIDLSEFDNRIKHCQFLIASDVTNPFIGQNGASNVFGPQKGASPEDVENLESGLENFANRIKDKLQITIHSLPGAGAAGGIGGALIAFFNAEMKNGIEIVLEKTSFDKEIKNANLIITGEGKTDFQTKYGKVASGVSRCGKKYNIPTIIISGSLEKNIDELYDIGIISAFSIINKPMNLDQAMEQTSSLIENTISQVMRTFTYHLQQ